MSVKLRLTRVGRKKRPYYRIVAVDSRRKRDGAFIDRLGYYHPLEDPPGVHIDAYKALKWLRNGAIPSDTVLSLLRREGVWYRFRLEKRGLPEQQIDEMMKEWFAARAEAAAKKPAVKAVKKGKEPKVEPAAETAEPPAGKGEEEAVEAKAEPPAETPAAPEEPTAAPEPKPAAKKAKGKGKAKSEKAAGESGEKPSGEKPEAEPATEPEAESKGKPEGGDESAGESGEKSG